MDEFILNIDQQKFRSTNGPWNELMLNDPWSVGYVTSIIEYKNFANKEEWEELYYKTGEYRDQLINEKYSAYSEILNNESLIKVNPVKVSELKYDIKQINFAHGRTKDQIKEKAYILHQHMINLKQKISLAECIECVRFRTICETWNGVVLRERNTISALKNIFPNYDYRKVPGEIDHKYGVDIEVIKNEKLFLGLQIKPKSYLSNAPYILKAKNANYKKNQEYLKDFGVKVINVISNIKGDILNIEEVKREL